MTPFIIPAQEQEESPIDVESGKRHPAGAVLVFVVLLMLCWSLFQLSVAGFFTLDALRVRVIHLAFAIFAAFLLFPALKTSPTKTIPWHDWLLAIVSSLCVLYILFDQSGIETRPGAPIGRDIAVGIVLLLLLLEAARRALGPALALICLIFSAYAFLGPYLPDIISHRGYSISRFVDHQFLTTEGIFGVPLGVSSAYVFLFVLFGSLLEKGGAGQYFIDLSFSLLGRFRGGPAKAAILASGFTGMVNGSSVANTVTTGTFTIPLMKKVGYPAEKAAAIEVAASTNGQLMPPIMGAAAFIIAEFLGITYLEVVRAAIIPALASYLALFYISHLEALKLDLKGTPKSDLPKFIPTFVRGLHFLIPVVVLVSSLLYYRLSPVTAAFNSIVILMAIMIVDPFTKAVVAKGDIKKSFIEGFNNIFNGLTGGARNMVAIAIATASAGIIVGTVTLTGLGLRAVEIIEAISMGSLFLMLGVTAISCLVLGMGLPTTANYIVMATLTAPVIVALADKSGFEIPLIAVHLFVFYFGILADDTPPVGLAAYAAAGIAGSDPIKTGIQGFFYDMRTAILPFMFIFNTDLLLIGVNSIWYGVMVFALAVAGMFAFASATLGFIIRPTSILERFLLVVVAIFMVNPTLPSRIVELPHAYIYSVTGIIIYGFIIGRQIINAKTEFVTN